MRVHRRRRREADRLADVAHRRRIAVLGRVLLDEVEDLLLALRQVLRDVHGRPSSGRLLGGWIGCSEHVFEKVARAQDGLNRRQERGYTRQRPRADGGIGRRARLRAWSGITGWRFESSSAHLEKPRKPGLLGVLQ